MEYEHENTISGGELSLENDELSLEDELIIENIHDDHCRMQHGLMVIGIFGALVSATVSAPIVAVVFLGIWGAGAGIELNDQLKECCNKKILKIE